MKRRTAREWLGYLGSEVMDPDGWRARGCELESLELLTAEEFRDRWHESTVLNNTAIIYVNRRNSFDFIIG
jgi:hypothetical protein